MTHTQEPERPYHRDDLRSELIETGMRLLDEEGYDAFSLRKLAKACNVSHAAPYRHFKSKEDLILEIAHVAMTSFELALQAAVDKYPGDPASQLRELGCAYVEFFLDNPVYMRLLFLSDIGKKLMEQQMGAASDAKLCEPIGSGSFDVLHDTVRRYRADCDTPLAKMDEGALLLFCWGIVHGITILVLREEFPIPGDPRALARQIFWSDAVRF